MQRFEGLALDYWEHCILVCNAVGCYEMIASNVQCAEEFKVLAILW